VTDVMEAVDPVVDVPVVRRRRSALRWMLRIAIAALILALFGVLLWFAGVELATPDGTGYASHLDLSVARWFAANRGTGLVWLAEAIGVVTGTAGVLVGAVVAGPESQDELDRPRVVLAEYCCHGLLKMPFLIEDRHDHADGRPNGFLRGLGRRCRQAHGGVKYPSAV